MRMLKLPFLALLLLVGMGLASPAQAALVARLGGQAVYDTDRNITWLADANVIGSVNWYAANTWAAGLNVGGFTGWRLPTSDTACYPYNCTNSELGHLYYTEGGVTQGRTITSSPYLSRFFSNMQNTLYWSDTDYNPFAPKPWGGIPHAWVFNTGYGNQGVVNKKDSYSMYAWAVRDGDVGGPAVPEPEQYMMMLVGGCAIWLRIRARRRG